MQYALLALVTSTCSLASPENVGAGAKSGHNFLVAAAKATGHGSLQLPAQTSAVQPSVAKFLTMAAREAPSKEAHGPEKSFVHAAAKQTNWLSRAADDHSKTEEATDMKLTKGSTAAFLLLADKAAKKAQVKMADTHKVQTPTALGWQAYQPSSGNGARSHPSLMQADTQTQGAGTTILVIFIVVVVLVVIGLLWHNNWNAAAATTEAKYHVHSAAVSIERRTRPHDKDDPYSQHQTYSAGAPSTNASMQSYPPAGSYPPSQNQTYPPPSGQRVRQTPCC